MCEIFVFTPPKKSYEKGEEKCNEPWTLLHDIHMHINFLWTSVSTLFNISTQMRPSTAVPALKVLNQIPKIISHFSP